MTDENTGYAPSEKNQEKKCRRKKIEKIDWEQATKKVIAENDPLAVPVEERASFSRVFEGGLTIQQERFAQAYVANGGDAKAAFTAVYGKNCTKYDSPYDEKIKTMFKGAVEARIQQIARNALAATQVTPERVVAEYAKIAFSNMGDYFPDGVEGGLDLNKLTPDQKAAIQELKIDRVRTINDDDGEPTGYVEKVTFKLGDKRAALGDLAKHLNMFKEQHEIGLSSDLTELLSALDGTTPRIPGAKPNLIDLKATDVTPDTNNTPQDHPGSLHALENPSSNLPGSLQTGETDTSCGVVPENFYGCCEGDMGVVEEGVGDDQ